MINQQDENVTPGTNPFAGSFGKAHDGEGDNAGNIAEEDIDIEEGGIDGDTVEGDEIGEEEVEEEGDLDDDTTEEDDNDDDSSAKKGEKGGGSNAV